MKTFLYKRTETICIFSGEEWLLYTCTQQPTFTEWSSFAWKLADYGITPKNFKYNSLNLLPSPTWTPCPLPPLSSQKKTNKTKKTQKKQKISQKTKQQQQHNNETKNTQTHTEVHKIWKCSIYGSVAKSMIKDIPKAN